MSIVFSCSVNLGQVASDSPVCDLAVCRFLTLGGLAGHKVGGYSSDMEACSGATQVAWAPQACGALKNFQLILGSPFPDSWRPCRA